MTSATRRGTGAAVGAVLLCVVAVAPAAVAWTVDESGNAAVAATSLGAPGTPAVSVAGRSVTLSWAAATLEDGTPADAYAVTRVSHPDGATVAIGAGCAGLLLVTGCTETGVAPGLWTYRVTAHRHAWSGPAAAVASPVTVVDPDPPAGSLTFPIGGGVYRAATWVAGCGTSPGDLCGTAAPGPTGQEITSVVVTIRRVGGPFWDGAAFASSEPVGHSVFAAAVPAAQQLTDPDPMAEGAGDLDSGRLVGEVSVVEEGQLIDDDPASHEEPVPADDGSDLDIMASATLDVVAAAGPVAWSYGLAAEAFDADGLYEVLVETTDGWDAVRSTGATFAVDRTAPTASVTAPANGSSVGAGTSVTLTAAAADATSGLATVQFERRPAGGSWDAVGPALAAAPWTTQASFAASGAHEVRVVATDLAGNVHISTATSLTSRPNVTGIVFVNSGTAGQLDRGDSVSVTFNEAMDASSFCSTWSPDADGSLAGNGQVTLSVSPADVLTVAASGCSGGFAFGSLALGGNYNSGTSPRSFSANGANKSTISWTAATRTLTFVFGSDGGSSATVPAPAPLATYHPSAVVRSSGQVTQLLDPVTSTPGRF